MSDAQPRHILITGAAGAVGRIIAPALIERGHNVRGIDRAPNTEIEDMLCADLVNRKAVDQAMRDIDCVIHLAAHPFNGDFIDELLEPNVIGLHHVFESAHQHQVQRFILASTTQVATGLERINDKPIRPCDGTKTHSYYGLTKIWAEHMGQLYAHEHKMAVLAVRLGWVLRNEKEARMMADRDHAKNLYFSHSDAARFFDATVQADRPAAGEFEVVYAMSQPHDRAVFSLEETEQLLNWKPRDRWPENLPNHWEIPCDA